MSAEMTGLTVVESRGRLLSDEERMDPSHTALVLIDIQNDFCHPDGAFGKLGHDLSMMPPMAERTRVLLDAARRRGLLTLFVRATYDTEVLGAPLAETYNRRGFTESQCLEGTWDAGWYAGLAPDPARPQELTVTKHRFSAFWGTEIDLYLRSNGVKTVVFTGVVTSGCVESTLRDAFFRDYYVVAVRDAVAEASVDRHEASLRKIDQAFGAVRLADEVASIWDRSNAPGIDISIEGKLKRALTTLPERVDPHHAALVLVDLQRDFCAPDGVMGRQGEDLSDITGAVAQAARLLQAARAAGMAVIHVKAEYAAADASDVSLFTSKSVSGTFCCRPDTTGSDFMPEVAPLPGEWVVVKHRFSGFVDTRLDLLLRSNGIRSIVVGGVATQCCVESTVRDASLRDYYVVVAREATAARGRMRHLHEASLEVMSLFFADCRGIDEVIAAMPAVRQTA
jgi:nicotinamidase-related amidase